MATSQDLQWSNMCEIPQSKVGPWFLHGNSTSHSWVFSAFAELIDNAYDPLVRASEIWISSLKRADKDCLVFCDNGTGMDSEKLHDMLSFGFSTKDSFRDDLTRPTIGQYGNGFKSGSMRIGDDAIVFTRCESSASIGFLSQTFLKEVGAESVLVPIVTYNLPKLERINCDGSDDSLEAILKYSVFQSEKELKDQLIQLEEGSNARNGTGTKIFIFNLRRLDNNLLELDFVSDPTDIRCPNAQENAPEYSKSLKEYCSILYLRPKLKIFIRNQKVKTQLVSKSLSRTMISSYKQQGQGSAVKIIFGFTCNTDRAEDYGMMMYYRKRLVKAYEKLGCQKQGKERGMGVVGVVEVDFLTPIHNKQDFEKDDKYIAAVAAFAKKLNEYCDAVENNQTGVTDVSVERAKPDWTWAQCDLCLKWRRMPEGTDPESLPDKWYCRNNPDSSHNRCDVDEEPEDSEGPIVVAKKPRKRKSEEPRAESTTIQPGKTGDGLKTPEPKRGRTEPLTSHLGSPVNENTDTASAAESNPQVKVGLPGKKLRLKFPCLKPKGSVTEPGDPEVTNALGAIREEVSSSSPEEHQRAAVKPAREDNDEIAELREEVSDLKNKLVLKDYMLKEKDNMLEQKDNMLDDLRRQLKEMERRFGKNQKNMHEVLTQILSDYDLGSVEDIEALLESMVEDVRARKLE